MPGAPYRLNSPSEQRQRHYAAKNHTGNDFTPHPECIVHFMLGEFLLVGVVVAILAAGFAKDSAVRLPVDQDQRYQKRDEEDRSDNEPAEQRLRGWCRFGLRRDTSSGCHFVGQQEIVRCSKFRPSFEMSSCGLKLGCWEVQKDVAIFHLKYMLSSKQDFQVVKCRVRNAESNA